MSARSVSPGSRPYARVAWNPIGPGPFTPRLQYPGVMTTTPRGVVTSTTIGGSSSIPLEQAVASKILAQASGAAQTQFAAAPVVWTSAATSATTTKSTTASSGPTSFVPTKVYSVPAHYQAASSLATPRVSTHQVVGSMVVPQQHTGNHSSTLDNSVVSVASARGRRDASISATLRTRSQSVADRFAMTDLDRSLITPTYRNIGVPGLCGSSLVKPGTTRVIVRKSETRAASPAPTVSVSVPTAIAVPHTSSTRVATTAATVVVPTNSSTIPHSQRMASTISELPTRAYHSMKLANGTELLAAAATGSSGASATTSSAACTTTTATTPSRVVVPASSGGPPASAYNIVEPTVLVQQGASRVDVEDKQMQKFMEMNQGHHPGGAVQQSTSLTSDSTTGSSLPATNHVSSLGSDKQGLSSPAMVMDTSAVEKHESRFTSVEVSQSPVQPAVKTTSSCAYSPDGAPLLAEIDLLRSELVKEQSARKHLEGEMHKLEAQLAKLSAELASKDLGGSCSGSKSEKEHQGTASTSLSPTSARGAAHTHQFTDEADLEIQKYVKKNPDFPYAIEKIGRGQYVFGKEKKEVFKRGAALLVRVGGGTESLVDYMEHLHQKGSVRQAA
ncbi:unnamed protein product [Amoebophrya sp. A120]|nr:unnamed protein product [Amoebophrya sp. A120]|eukprot:GSA120T00003299001.1